MAYLSTDAYKLYQALRGGPLNARQQRAVFANHRSAAEMRRILAELTVTGRAEVTRASTRGRPRIASLTEAHKTTFCAPGLGAQDAHKTPSSYYLGNFQEGPNMPSDQEFDPLVAGYLGDQGLPKLDKTQGFVRPSGSPSFHEGTKGLSFSESRLIPSQDSSDSECLEGANGRVCAETSQVPRAYLAGTRVTRKVRRPPGKGSDPWRLALLFEKEARARLTELGMSCSGAFNRGALMKEIAKRLRETDVTPRQVQAMITEFVDGSDWSRMDSPWKLFIHKWFSLCNSVKANKDVESDETKAKIAARKKAEKELAARALGVGGLTRKSE